MESVSKKITKGNHSKLYIYVPEVYVKLLGLNCNKVRIRSGENGYFLLEKSENNNGISLCENRLAFPSGIIEKYRLSENHTVTFFENKGRVIFKFAKQVS
ncbi:hypothetical protein D3C76_646250 [compost metagenome]